MSEEERDNIPHEGRAWFEEELRKFNEHQAQRSKAKAEGDAEAVARLDEDEDYIYDQLDQAWKNRNNPGPFTGPETQ